MQAHRSAQQYKSVRDDQADLKKRIDYNDVRPHRVIGYKVPSALMKPATPISRRDPETRKILQPGGPERGSRSTLIENPKSVDYTMGARQLDSDGARIETNCLLMRSQRGSVAFNAGIEIEKLARE